MASDVEPGPDNASFVAGPIMTKISPSHADFVAENISFAQPTQPFVSIDNTGTMGINSSDVTSRNDSVMKDIQLLVPEEGKPVPTRKRRHSSHYPAGNHNNSPKFTSPQHIKKRRKTAAITQPMKFLLGGNSTDPLNLNSLVTGDPCAPVVSPYCSPAPRNKDPNPFLFPKDITDPLNIKSGDDKDNSDPTTVLGPPKSGGKKKKRHSHRKRSDVGLPRKEGNIDLSSDGSLSEVFEKDANDKEVVSQSETMPRQSQRNVDKIVSPVLDAFDDTSPKLRRKRKDASSKISRSLLRGESGQNEQEVNRTSCKYRRQHSGENKLLPKCHSKGKLFQYGNYNQYYGKRNPEQEDCRLKCFCTEWFRGKDVLDIGCNIGHVTLTIAKDFEPRKITGIDIDGNLISIARKNIRHYLSPAWSFMGQKFPISMDRCHGPIAAPPIPQSGMDHTPRFPNNVMFRCCNYVLETDALLSLQRPEYDVIMCLSVSKWIHLNFGDEGLKRAFKRVYLQLRPGGRFIFEPQSWQSYSKKKKLTDTIHKNYREIRLKPETFTEYLLSRDVGFTKCEVIDTPLNSSKGFRRPVLMFIKSRSSTENPEHHRSSKHHSSSHHKSRDHHHHSKSSHRHSSNESHHHSVKARDHSEGRKAEGTSPVKTKEHIHVKCSNVHNEALPAAVEKETLEKDSSAVGKSN
ncbi:7SK snRNA methylphosphate capping enzyme-like [Saccoglossus kowalevskii]|uniref:RNA methyltransferase n=1 Tax=Saccoglossus kowalevskii TaxID=10224 RepID=A0ABM0MWS5_SACKO|nr:PREDICTED: 7SK snRNA methylphosphate capping enzyme-like [Saccoglossus kowalevskii]